jgi:hypothetical protein
LHHDTTSVDAELRDGERERALEALATLPSKASSASWGRGSSSTPSSGASPQEPFSKGGGSLVGARGIRATVERGRRRAEEGDVLPLLVVGLAVAPNPNLTEGDETRAPRRARVKDLQRNPSSVLETNHSPNHGAVRAGEGRGVHLAGFREAAEGNMDVELTQMVHTDPTCQDERHPLHVAGDTIGFLFAHKAKCGAVKVEGLVEHDELAIVGEWSSNNIWD